MNDWLENLNFQALGVISSTMGIFWLLRVVNSCRCPLEEFPLWNGLNLEFKKHLYNQKPCLLDERNFDITGKLLNFTDCGRGGSRRTELRLSQSSRKHYRKAGRAHKLMKNCFKKLEAPLNRKSSLFQFIREAFKRQLHSWRHFTACQQQRVDEISWWEPRANFWGTHKLGKIILFPCGLFNYPWAL